MKRLVLILLLCIGLPGLAAAESIDRFDVRIAVHADGSLQVDETIRYDFGHLQKHGIFRDIPRKVYTPLGIRDIGLGQYAVKMDGQPVRWVEESLAGDAGPLLRLKIGDPRRTITGTHTYTLHYRVALGVLAASGGRDAIRWNVTGTGWPVSIATATVTVELPPQLSRDDIQAATFTGAYGSTANTATFDWPDAQTFTAMVRGLADHEGMTFELAYPAGLLSQTSQLSGLAWLQATVTAFWHWLLFAIGAAFLFGYWWRNGRDPSTGPLMVGYEPPEGMDAAQVGLLRDQSVDGIDIGGAVLELARDGYLAIEHEEKQFLGLKPEKITLTETRGKPVAELPHYKRQLLHALFHGGKTLTLGSTVSASRGQQIKKDIEAAKEMLYEWSVEQGFMHDNPKRVRRRFALWSSLAMLPLLLLAGWSSFERFGSDIFGALFFVSVFLSLGGGFLFAGKGGIRLFGAIWVLMSGFFITQMFKDMGLHAETLLHLPLLAMVLLLALALGFSRWMPMRTLKGTRAYGRILGYREFMLRVDQDRLERYIRDNPTYLERTLPYAVSLDVVEQWVKRFENLQVALPAWYHGDIGHFTSFSTAFSSGIGTVGATSSGGSSGGGGFSGGGGGGGGGGSW